MELSYNVYNPGEDVEMNLPPIVLIHGMLDSKMTWKFLAPDIARRTGRKVYALDARNHGESPWSEDFTFDIIAEDVNTFLDHHGIRRAIVAGHSMGGRTALTMALKYPEKVEKLIVEDMTTINFQPNQTSLLVSIIDILDASIEHIPEGVDELGAKRAVVKYLKSFMSLGKNSLPKGSQTFDWSMIPLKKSGTSYSWKANLGIIKDMLTTDKIKQGLSGVYMGDALFLYGTKSFFKVDRDRRIPKMFPKAQILPIEGATHLVHFEFPKRFVDEIVTFINGHIASKL